MITEFGLRKLAEGEQPVTRYALDNPNARGALYLAGLGGGLGAAGGGLYGLARGINKGRKIEGGLLRRMLGGARGGLKGGLKGAAGGALLGGLFMNAGNIADQLTKSVHPVTVQ